MLNYVKKFSKKIMFILFIFLNNCSKYRNFTKKITYDINEILEKNNIEKFDKEVLPFINEEQVKDKVKDKEQYLQIMHKYNSLFEELFNLLGRQTSIQIEPYLDFLKKSVEKQNNFSIRDIINDLLNKNSFSETIIYKYLQEVQIPKELIYNIQNFTETHFSIADNEEKENYLNYNFQWQYLGKTDNFIIWINLPSIISDILECGYKFSKSYMLYYEYDNSKYIFNLHTFKQTNIDTLTQKTLKRISKNNENSEIKDEMYLWKYKYSELDKDGKELSLWINMDSPVSDLLEYRYHENALEVNINIKNIPFKFFISQKANLYYQTNLKSGLIKFIRRVPKFKECDICAISKDWEEYNFECTEPFCNKLVCKECIIEIKKRSAKCPFCTKPYIV